MSEVIEMTKFKKKAKSHVAFLSFLLVAAIICFFLMSPIFEVENITVMGNVKTTEQEVISSSDIIYGQNIMQINKIAIANKILNLPYVKDVNVRRNWPNRISISIEEKKPVAEMVFYGSKILLDSEGYILEVVTDDFDANLTVLEGINTCSIIAGEKIECDNQEILQSYLEILKIFDNNDMLNKVDKISYSADEFTIFLTEGHIVNFGGNDNLQYKVMLLNEIIEREFNTAYIDLSNLEMIITKPVWGMFNTKENGLPTQQ